MVKKATILIIGFMVIVLVFSGCIKKPVVNQNTNKNINTNQSPSPSPSQTEIDTSDWKTYRNEEFGFEFRYPSDWTISDPIPNSNFNITLKPKKVSVGKYYITISRTLLNLDNLESSKLCQELLSRTNKYNFNQSKDICGGTIIDVAQDGLVSKSTLFSTGKLIMQFISRPGFEATKEEEIIYTEIYNQVIESIRIL